MVWNWFKHWLGQIVYIDSRPDSCSIHSYTESVRLSSSRYVYGCPAVCGCAECALLLWCIASSSISIVVWPRNSSKVQFKSNPQYTRSQQVSPTYENKHWTMLITNMNLTAAKMCNDMIKISTQFSQTSHTCPFIALYLACFWHFTSPFL